MYSIDFSLPACWGERELALARVQSQGGNRGESGGSRLSRTNIGRPERIQGQGDPPPHHVVWPGPAPLLSLQNDPKRIQIFPPLRGGRRRARKSSDFRQRYVQAIQILTHPFPALPSAPCPLRPQDALSTPRKSRAFGGTNFGERNQRRKAGSSQTSRSTGAPPSLAETDPPRLRQRQRRAQHPRALNLRDARVFTTMVASTVANLR